MIDDQDAFLVEKIKEKKKKKREKNNPNAYP